MAGPFLDKKAKDVERARILADLNAGRLLVVQVTEIRETANRQLEQTETRPSIRKEYFDSDVDAQIAAMMGDLVRDGVVQKGTFLFNDVEALIWRSFLRDDFATALETDPALTEFVDIINANDLVFDEARNKVLVQGSLARRDPSHALRNDRIEVAMIQAQADNRLPENFASSMLFGGIDAPFNISGFGTLETETGVAYARLILGNFDEIEKGVVEASSANSWEDATRTFFNTDAADKLFPALVDFVPRFAEIQARDKFLTDRTDLITEDPEQFLLDSLSLSGQIFSKAQLAGLPDRARADKDFDDFIAFGVAKINAAALAQEKSGPIDPRALIDMAVQYVSPTPAERIHRGPRAPVAADPLTLKIQQGQIESNQDKLRLEQEQNRTDLRGVSIKKIQDDTFDALGITLTDEDAKALRGSLVRTADSGEPLADLTNEILSAVRSNPDLIGASISQQIAAGLQTERDAISVNRDSRASLMRELVRHRVIDDNSTPEFVEAMLQRAARALEMSRAANPNFTNATDTAAIRAEFQGDVPADKGFATSQALDAEIAAGTDAGVHAVLTRLGVINADTPAEQVDFAIRRLSSAFATARATDSAASLESVARDMFGLPSTVQDPTQPPQIPAGTPSELLGLQFAQQDSTQPPPLPPGVPSLFAQGGPVLPALATTGEDFFNAATTAAGGNRDVLRGFIGTQDDPRAGGLLQDFQTERAARFKRRREDAETGFKLPAGTSASDRATILAGERAATASEFSLTDFLREKEPTIRKETPRTPTRAGLNIFRSNPRA
jgi:hypothetical protein